MNFDTPFEVLLSDGRTWKMQWTEAFLKGVGKHRWWKPTVSDLADINDLKCPDNFQIELVWKKNGQRWIQKITYVPKTTKKSDAKNQFVYIGDHLDTYHGKCAFVSQTGILTWIRVRWSGQLLIGELATLMPTPGQTTVRSNVLHISMMFKEEIDVTDEDYLRLQKFIAKWSSWKITKIPLVYIGGHVGSFCEISPRWPHYKEFIYFEQKGWYANRELHCSLLH